MSIPSDYEILFDEALEVDPSAERAADADLAILGDESVRLLMRENRIALARGKSPRTLIPDDKGRELAQYDVPLLCVVHSHPECRFRWCRLAVKLSPGDGTRVCDMVPREVRGDRPVELKTSIGVGLKYEVAEKLLSAEISPELSHSHTVYYPEIVSSGVGFTTCYWDFLALTSDYLHANRELRLLVRAPASLPVSARFKMRAKVRFAGLGGLVPLLGRSVDIDKFCYLA